MECLSTFYDQMSINSLPPLMISKMNIILQLVPKYHILLAYKNRDYPAIRIVLSQNENDV